MPSTPVKSQPASTQLSPIRTPLKNNSSTVPAPPSPLTRISPRRRTAQEEEERFKNRQEMAKKRQESKTALLSPAGENCPKAESPSIKRSTSGLSASLSSDAAISPVTSRANLAMRASTSASKLNAAPPMTAEQMTKSFEEWMKMAADNKINSKNSWSFALIDYFSELTFLRDGDSINFQKASCTLDGCVKIYASRVDSIVDETTKLLNGLTDKKVEASPEEGEGDEEGEEGIVKSSKSARKSTRPVETIEKNPEALTLKNFDLEFSIDPLFKKTSAEFDESGSRGTLLRSLEVSPIDNLVIFDSSDKIPIDFGIFDDDGDEQSASEIDISNLQEHFGSALIDLETDKSLCGTFENYSFSAISAKNTIDLSEMMERLAQVTAHIPQNDTVNYVSHEPDDDYYEEDNFAMDNDNYGDEDEAAVMEEDAPDQKHVHWSKDTQNDETGLSYFDSAFKQNWAGPEHWKIRRSSRIASAPSKSSSNEETIGMPSSAASTRRPSKQEKPAIDFATFEVDLRTIFAKATTSSTITLGKAAILERNESNHLLPDDLHFNSSNLLKLFIKPEWKLNRTKESDNRRSSRLRQSYSAVESGITGNFLDREFWISNNDGQERKDGVFEAYNQAVVGFEDQEEEVESDGGNYDDFDDFGPSAVVESSEQVNFSQQMVAAPRFTFAPQLNYARVAKRVDIAKLKATLWHDFLETTNSDPKPSKTKKKEENSENVSNSSNNNTFSGLISNLSKSYPNEALADVSVPYCFICLLHLANENNLEIKPTESDLIILN